MIYNKNLEVANMWDDMFFDEDDLLYVLFDIEGQAEDEE